jgi:hypothetical protein
MIENPIFSAETKIGVRNNFSIRLEQKQQVWQAQLEAGFPAYVVNDERLCFYKEAIEDLLGYQNIHELNQLQKEHDERSRQ